MGIRLRAERERLGLTQEQLAVAAGANKITVFRYEGGAHLPTLSFLVAVEAVGVDVGYVLDGKRSMVVLGLDDAALLGRALAVIDDLLDKHHFSPSEEVHGRLILQVLKDAHSSASGSKIRMQSLDKLIEELTK
ncbi:regulatory protein [Hylemonella gracilis str. Niagara R]|uniref:Regulatory protein n=1 Tax=Hylemonella gracilis str. Niagara R TaxID=1458275 RepID=A0A016XDV1_9BURK|nr:regulatory protein [Hylemonella gracilis str. Niagara R]